MKTLLLLTLCLGLFSCAGAGSGSADATEVWVQPATNQEAYDRLVGKTFNGSNGNVFRFREDGSVEAVFTDVSNETLSSATVQKTFTCDVTASSFTVILTALDGTLVIELNNPTVNQIGVAGSATTVPSCFIFSADPLAKRLSFERTSLNTLTKLLSNYQPTSPPASSGYYEGNGKESYTKQ